MIFNVNKEYELHKVVAAFKSDDYLKKTCINILSFDSFNKSFSKELKTKISHYFLYLKWINFLLSSKNLKTLFMKKAHVYV